MKVRNIIVALLFSASTTLCVSAQQVAINLIPEPQEMEVNKGECNIEKLSTIYFGEGTQVQAQLLSQLLYRATAVELSTAQMPIKSPKKGILINVDSSMDSMTYALSVTNGRVLLSAGSVRTLAQSLSTLLQLTQGAGRSAVLPLVEIEDKPAIEWRAAMVDVARRWHPLESLKEMVELFHYYKIDKMHLHLTDNESFTFGSEKFPKLLINNPDGTPRYYTKAELRELVAFADARGIEVIPEIDLPGHSGKLWTNYPEEFGAVDSLGKPIGLSAVNMVKESTYVNAEILLQEVADVFTNTPYIHLGGDEVWMGAVSKLPEYKSFCERHNLQGALDGNPSEVYAYFMARADSIVRVVGKKTILWEGFPSTGLGRIKIPNDIPIVVWNSNYNPPADLLKNGFSIINAMWEPCYMCGAMNYAPDVVEGLDWAHNKFRHWNHLLNDKTLDESIPVMGGQFCFWEQQYDILYPVLKTRLPALSYRWWNYGAEIDYDKYVAKAAVVAAKAEQLLRPVQISVVDGQMVSKESFVEPVKVSFTRESPVQGEIRYSLLPDWTIPELDNSLFESSPVTIVNSTIVSAQLYDSEGNKVGYPTQLRFERIDPVMEYFAYKEPPQKGWAEMPDFDTLKEVQTGFFGRVDRSRHSQIQRNVFYGIEQDGHIDTRPEGLYNPFALKMRGVATITEGGVYKFIAKNQDGNFAIKIGDNIYSSTLSNYKPQEFEFNLVPGQYDVEICYYYRHIQNVLNIKYFAPNSTTAKGFADILNTLSVD